MNIGDTISDELKHKYTFHWDVEKDKISWDQYKKREFGQLVRKEFWCINKINQTGPKQMVHNPIILMGKSQNYTDEHITKISVSF